MAAPHGVSKVRKFDDKATHIKVVVLGARNVGKTCFLLTLANYVFPRGVSPPSIEINPPRFHHEGRFYCLDLHEPPVDDESYDSRCLQYPGTDVLILCFAAELPSSFDHVRTKWLIEANQHCPGVPVILIYTKMDNRFDKDANEATLSTYGRECISKDEGIELSQSLGITNYFECSTLTNQGMTPLPHVIIRVYLESVGTPPKKDRSRCSII